MENFQDPAKKPQEIIGCKAAAKLLSESFEHELSLSKKIALRAHLALCNTCIYCRRQLKALRAVFKNYDQAVALFPPPSNCCLSAEAKKRMKASLSQESSTPDQA